MVAADNARTERWLRLGSLVFAVLYCGLALARYHSFHNHTFDLAEYARLAWGLGGMDGYDPIIDLSFMAGHRPLILVPLGVLARVFDGVHVLLVSQALVLAFTAVPLGRLAYRRLGSRQAAMAVALAWWLYPNLSHVAGYEFHPGNLAMLPMATALDALDRRDGRSLLLSALWILACRWDLALVTGAMAVLGLSLGPALRSACLGLLAVSVAYFGSGMLGLDTDASGATGSMSLHFGHLGGSPLGALPMLVNDPAALWAHLGQTDKLLYPLRVLAPLALLPLLSPRWLLPALPILAINTLSQFPTTVHLYSHYLTPAVPTLVVAAVMGLSRYSARRWLPMGAMLLATAAGSVLASGFPWSRDFVVADYRDDERGVAARRLLAHVPPAASIQTPDFLLAHLADRPVLRRGPPPERGTEYVVLDTSHRQRYAGREVLLRTSEEPNVRNWLKRTDHGMVAAEAGMILLARKAPSRGGPLQRYFGRSLTGGSERHLGACLWLTGASLEGSLLWLHLRANGPCPADLAVRLGYGGQPSRVDLLFDGLLSPAKIRAGDRLRSPHSLTDKHRTLLQAGELRLGLLRSSGAKPLPTDPDNISLRIQ